ncbi:unnamed protein product [Protopolystoma xenopodis]|uniref:Uncharacterized protein n=1 Tax=Protopolystoma xenopodis TaxID=117903 RepID=A0A3S5AF34_9PLAT|nr:unnamed protein product [Protopolystoma xenopodis]
MGSYSAMITRRHLFKPDRPGPSIFPTSQQPPTVSATPPPTATAFPAVSACSHAAQFSGIWSQTLPIHRSRLAVSSPTSAGFAVVGSSSVVEAQAVQFAALKAPDATVTAADPAHTNVTIRSLVSQPPSPPTMANPLLASAVSTSQSGPLFARAVRRGQLQEWPATHFSELNQEAGTSRALVPEPSGSPVEAGSTAPISQALPELSEPLPVGHVARAQVDSGQEGRTDGSHVQKDERSQSDAPTMPEPEPHEPISTRLRKFRTSAGEPISPRLRHLFSRQKK